MFRKVNGSKIKYPFRVVKLIEGELKAQKLSFHLPCIFLLA